MIFDLELPTLQSTATSESFQSTATSDREPYVIKKYQEDEDTFSYRIEKAGREVQRLGTVSFTSTGMRRCSPTIGWSLDMSSVSRSKSILRSIVLVTNQSDKASLKHALSKFLHISIVDEVMDCLSMASCSRNVKPGSREESDARNTQFSAFFELTARLFYALDVLHKKLGVRMASWRIPPTLKDLITMHLDDDFVSLQSIASNLRDIVDSGQGFEFLPYKYSSLVADVIKYASDVGEDSHLWSDRLELCGPMKPPEAIGDIDNLLFLFFLGALY